MGAWAAIWLVGAGLSPAAEAAPLRAAARIEDAYRRGDDVALARAAVAPPMGSLARMLRGARVEQAAAAAALVHREDGILLVDKLVEIGGAELDVALASEALQAVRRILAKAHRATLESYELPNEVVAAVMTSLLQQCVARAKPAALRVEALASLVEVDRLTGSGSALECAAALATDPQADLRVAAVEAFARHPAENAAALNGLAADVDAEVGAQAMLALCRSRIPRDAAPRAAAPATPVRAPLPALLAEDLKGCARRHASKP